MSKIHDTFAEKKKHFQGAFPGFPGFFQKRVFSQVFQVFQVPYEPCLYICALRKNSVPLLPEGTIKWKHLAP